MRWRASEYESDSNFIEFSIFPILECIGDNRIKLLNLVSSVIVPNERRRQKKNQKYQRCRAIAIIFWSLSAKQDMIFKYLAFLVSTNINKIEKVL